MTNTAWCLKTLKLPQRLDLEISDHAFECLQQLSIQAGTSVRELAERLLHNSVSSSDWCA